MPSKSEQIDRMIDEGLGGGIIENEGDKKQLENPISKKPLKEIESSYQNTMAGNIEELKKLGKEMEQMKTNQEVRKEGREPSPTQDELDIKIR